MGDVEFKGVGGGEFGRVSLAGFTELGEARMDRVGVVCRIGMLELKGFPAEAAGKEGNISNQLEIVKTGFQGY